MTQTRDSVFSRIYVDYMMRGATRVTWEMRRTFTDDTPWSFQLQVSRNGGDTFENVGIPVVDTFYALDTTPRLYGKDQRLVYRVVLTTPNDTYTSPNAQIMGQLHLRQWLIAREIIRRHRLQAKQTGLRVLDGWLLKRKLQGQVCEHTDPHTGGIIKHDCDICYGTGIVGGYWKAAQDTMIDLRPKTENTQRDPSRGTVNDVVVTGRFVGSHWVNRNDVWVDATSDLRYYIWDVQHAAEINQVPIVIDAKMKPAEATDIIYTIDIDAL